MKEAFVGAKIIPIVGNELENGTIIIESGKIINIGENVDTAGCEIINCDGKIITPGFIDPHSHVGLIETGSRDEATHDLNETTESVTPHLRAKDAIFPEDQAFQFARAGGVTTQGITHGSANPIGGQFCVVKSYGIIVDEMILKEPAGIKMAMGENPIRTGQSNNRSPKSRMGVAFLIRKSFQEALDYLIEWEDYENKRLNAKKGELVKPPKRDFKLEILGKVLNKEIPVRCHSHRSDDIQTAIRLSEEFGYRLILDHATESYKIKELIISKNIPVILGPLFGMSTKPESKFKSMKTPGIMTKAGALVCITTDAPVVPIEGLRDTLIMAVRDGLSPDIALNTITINPAKVLGVDDRVGSLETGKDADFLIFNGDPLDLRSKVVQTYIDGNLVYNLEDE